MKKILILAAVILFFHGCTKENQKPDSTAKETVDPVNDLAAFLNGFDSTLYVLPEGKNEVIKALNAKQLEGNVYNFTAATISGNKIPYTFKLKESAVMLILFYVTDAQRNLADFFADKDTSRAKLIQKFKDSTGVFYRVYKNAQCTERFPQSATDCMEETVRVFSPIDSAYRNVKTGKFVKYEYQQVSQCFKGKNYCIEALAVSTTQKLFNDAACRTLLETKDVSYDYSCLK